MKPTITLDNQNRFVLFFDSFLFYEKYVLLESFIDKYNDKVDWYWVSKLQKLSEPFIEKYKNKLIWYNISQFQKLSEPFIEKHKGKVDWYYICIYQKLSEPFIEKYKKYVNWHYISKFQNLSEEFIEKNTDDVKWGKISLYQNLSKEFIEKYKDKLNIDYDNNLLYASTERKLSLIPDGYEVKDGYVYGYKAIRHDRYSTFNFQYRYEVGQTYESHCDHNLLEENSFGLSVWTEDKARDFYDRGIIIKVRFKIEDLGAVVHNGNKLRVKRLEILS